MASSPDFPWWNKTTVYQIYPRSFCDADGHGVGYLPGVMQRLDYLRALGVETLWLSPFFQGAARDAGDDVSGCYDVHPDYGTLDDFRRLAQEAHARGMKIVLDMLGDAPNAPCVEEPPRSREAPWRDRYIWRDLRHATLDVVRHWLAQGADGLRLDVFHALFKDPAFADGPFPLRPFPAADVEARRTPFRASAFRRLLRRLEASLAEPLLPSSLFGDPARPSALPRLGAHPERAKLLATVQLTARGVPCLSYGEEIGLPQLRLPPQQAEEPLASMLRLFPRWLAGRLPRLGALLDQGEGRRPMPCHAGAHDGATAAAAPGPPARGRWRDVDVAAQERDPRSRLSCFRRLLALRREHPALHAGALELLPGPARSLLAYRRRARAGQRPEVLDVILNFSAQAVSVDLPARGRILFSSVEPEEGPAAPERRYWFRGHEGIVVAHAG